MTSNPSDPAGPGVPRVPAADDTAAFQRFYFGPDGEPAGEAKGKGQPRSLLYRALVGWWRDRR
jgi:hypothetical protein